MYESTRVSSRIRKEAFAFICPSRTESASGRKCRRGKMVNLEAVIDLTKISKLELDGSRASDPSTRWTRRRAL